MNRHLSGWRKSFVTRENKHKEEAVKQCKDKEKFKYHGGIIICTSKVFIVLFFLLSATFIIA